MLPFVIADFHRAVGVELACEVVAFVLEDDCGESLDGFDRVLAGSSAVSYVHRSESWHFATFPRDRQASFAAQGHIAARRYDTYVRIYLERLSLLVKTLHCYDVAADSDLRSGYSDAVLLGLGYGIYEQFAEPVIAVRGQFILAEIGTYGSEYCQVLFGVNGEHPEQAVGVVDDCPFSLRPALFSVPAGGRYHSNKADTG